MHIIDYIYNKQCKINHHFGVGVGEGISFAEALDYYPRHLFQAQLLRQPSPVAVPCLISLAGQIRISRDRTTEGQKAETERWDKRAFARDRMAKVRTEWWDRTSRILGHIYMSTNGN